MKPRLKLIQGLWKCKGPAQRSGYGYTPLEAYLEWKWVNRK